MTRSFAPQLHAAILGQFDQEVVAGRQRFVASSQRAVFEVADEEQVKWRLDLLQSGLSKAAIIARGVRVRRYLNRGDNPAATVRTNAPLIQAAFEAEQMIRSKEGFWLTIPNPAVWPTGRVQRPRTRGSKNVSSVEIAERRFGKLRFVYRPKGVSFLVATVRDSAAKGAFRKATSRAAERAAKGNYSGLTTIVVFFLVKQARLRKRLHGRELRARAERTAPDRIVSKFVKYFESASPVGPIQLGQGETV